MDNVTTNQVDSTAPASSSEVKQNDTVSYESFRKSVEAEKNAKERARVLEAELEAKKNAELEAAGKHEEIIANLRAKTHELESSLKSERETRIWDNVTGAIKTTAIKQGCTDPDKLIRLFDKEDFSTLQAENGKIREDSLGALMEKAKKENHFLFSRGEVRINDATPSTNAPDSGKKLDVNSMTPKELEEYIKAKF
jgi:hypothetical protein